MNTIQKRKSLVSWLRSNLDDGLYRGLKWVNRDEGLFKVSWKHASRHEWSQETDSILFKDWAKYTKRFVDGDTPTPKRWKANFRCALNASPDIRSVKTAKGKDAFRIYQFSKKRHSSDEVRLRNVGFRYEKLKVKSVEVVQKTNTRNSKKTPCNCGEKNNVQKNHVKKNDVKSSKKDVQKDDDIKTPMKVDTSELHRHDKCVMKEETANIQPFNPSALVSSKSTTVTNSMLSLSEIIAQIESWKSNPNDVAPLKYSVPYWDSSRMNEWNTSLEEHEKNIFMSEDIVTSVNNVENIQPIYSSANGSFQKTIQSLTVLTQEDLQEIEEMSSSDSYSTGCSSESGLRIDEEDDTYSPMNEKVLAELENMIHNPNPMHEFAKIVTDTCNMAESKESELRFLSGDRNPVLSSLFLWEA